MLSITSLLVSMNSDEMNSIIISNFLTLQNMDQIH